MKSYTKIISCIAAMSIMTTLTACGKNNAWLRKTLAKEGLSSPAAVFLLTVDEGNTVVCIPKEGQT